MHALTQRSRARADDRRRRRVGARLGRAGGRGPAPRPLRARALGAGYAAAVAALNAAGLGPLDRNLSGPALRRGGLRGMREVLRASASARRT
jgi:hypothetical protein